MAPENSTSATLRSAASLHYGLSRTEATMDAIERFIATEQLQPGDPLPTEAELVSTLGVSRSSVREAIRQLKALEIVDVQKGRGAFVGDMSLRPFIKSMLIRYSISPDSLEGLRQVVSLRQILDRGISEELVSAFKGTHNPHLHSIVETMEDKASREELFTAEDIAFHSGVLSRIDNLLVEQMVSAMWEVHATVAQSLHQASPGSLQVTAHAHRLILDALEKGDVEAYMEAVGAHYRPLHDILTRRD